jgi:hypothetical protein
MNALEKTTAMRAAEVIRELRTPAEKREMAHHLCRYLVAILSRGQRPNHH